MTTPDQTSDKVRHRLDAWKRQLIDLTRRNQLLNYRPRRASTIDVVDEVPQIVMRQLLEGQRFYFDPRSDERVGDEGPRIGEGAREAYPGDPAEPAYSNPKRNHAGGAGLRRTSGRELAEHHQDDRLQTRHTEKKLEKRLLYTYRTAESSMEEQGVNALFLALGMLEWYESKDSDQKNRAPIVLLPAWLSRADASSPFTLTRGDEDPILNPALSEKLRLEFGLTLPDLPELSDDLDLDDFFFAVKKAVAGFSRWRVTSDIALGLFDFRKFVMYKDLERYSEQFAAHDVIRSMCGESEEPRQSSVPPEVENADLDEEMSPWSTIQVVEADSSQQRAMLAIRKGHHLVIEGPPGTGKSQTITNVIADALAEGKSVLFVSEKMAALEVVKARLETVGLGEFCLELHSHHTKKTEFVREMARTLDLAAQEVPGYNEELRKLETLTRNLKAYVEALHAPRGPLGMTPFGAISRLAELDEMPILTAEIPDLVAVDRETFQQTLEHLAALTRALQQVGDPAAHPLRGSGATDGAPTAQRELQNDAEVAAVAVRELIDESEEFAEDLGLHALDTFGDVQIALEGAAILARSPGTARSVLENPSWNQLSSEVEELIETGREYARLRPLTDERFRSSILEVDLSDEIEELATHATKALRFFKPAYWRVRGGLKAYATDTYRVPNVGEFVQHLRQANACRSKLLAIQAVDESGRALFADRWRAEESDWDDLQDFAGWVVDVRQYVLKEVFASKGYDLAAEGNLDHNRIARARKSLAERLEQARDAVAELTERGRFDEEAELGSAAGDHISRVLERAAEIAKGAHRLREWTLYRAARDRCARDPSVRFVDHAVAEDLEPSHLRPAFERLFLEKWLESVCRERAPLAEFQSIQHEARIDEFRDLDAASHEIARLRARGRLLKRRQRELLRADLANQLQLVQREAKKKSRILPIRKLLHHAPDVVKLIKPCFMMSPLSTAWYLDPNELSFDLLVFDEASQIPPADAVGSMIRANQIIVVGDSKQLPPTDFFSAQLDDSETSEDIEELALDDLESVLDEVATSGVPRLRLKWHYRSEHESLIRFSNEEYYSDDPLYTFPSAHRDRSSAGLQFEYLSDGIYEGRGTNSIEARRVADAVVEHVRRHSDWTLGVGTFGMAQQNRILDELDERRRAHPDIEFFFQREGEEKFFVKNLENIQGDDRDVIFISVTYGPGPDGVVRRNFGPINRTGGWRRLNVITTRAKKRLRVFSSMRADDIDVSGIARGAQDLQRYLKYAETGIYPTATLTGGEPDSPFEAAVIEALHGEGYQTVPQVGECGYRVDIAVQDPDFPGRFVCGIECDGASYHSALTVRDRDRLRQLVLESRGWDIHRVWSTDWYYDERGQIERLVNLIEESRDRLRTGRPRKPPARKTRIISAASKQEGPPSALEAEEKTPLEDIPVAPYRFAPPLEPRDPERFYETAIHRLAQDCLHVLEVEAPIHRSELAKRVAEFWGFSRLGSRIETRLSAAIDHLVSNGKAEVRRDFIWRRSKQKAPVRSRAIEGANFNSDFISAEEVAEAIRLLLTHRAPLLPNEIPTEVVRILGFKRSGRILQDLAAEAVERLVRRGELEPGGLGIRLQEQPPRPEVPKRQAAAEPVAGRDLGDEPPSSAERTTAESKTRSKPSLPARPFMLASVAELEAKVEANHQDRETLVQIAHELGFRSTKRAKQLALRIRQLI